MEGRAANVTDSIPRLFLPGERTSGLFGSMKTLPSAMYGVPLDDRSSCRLDRKVVPLAHRLVGGRTEETSLLSTTLMEGASTSRLAG